MSESSKAEMCSRISYADHAKIYGSGFVPASRIPCAGSEAHNQFLSAFESAADRAPNYEIIIALEALVDAIRRADDDDLPLTGDDDVCSSERAGWTHEEAVRILRIDQREREMLFEDCGQDSFEFPDPPGDSA